MSRLLWELLKRYLTLGAGEPDPDPDANPDPDPTAGSDTLDDLLDAEEILSGKQPPADEEDPKAALQREREASKKKDEDLERERAARVQAEMRAAQAAPPRQTADPEWEAEEERYRAAKAAGKSEDYLMQLKWTIDNGRIIRQRERQSQAALWRAEDTADKTAFDQLKVEKPKLYKAYSDRVEKAMAEMRARGQNAPRLAVLRLLVGDDMVSGKLKPKAKPKEDTDTVRVDRGKTPGARTDVRANGSKSERDKRRARLENQII